MTDNFPDDENEELWARQGDYFDSCVDKIYHHFQTYGYVWSIKGGLMVPTREQIIDHIKRGLYERWPCTSSGRIRIEYDKEEDKFEVSLEL